MKKLCGVAYVMRCVRPKGHPGRCRFVGSKRFKSAEHVLLIQHLSSKKPARSKN